MLMFALLSVLVLLLLSPALAQPAAPLGPLWPEFEKGLQQLHRESGVPGFSLAVVHHDQVVYLKGFGERRAGTGQAVDADTVFQVASCSKPITSTAVAALVSQGVLDWNDPISIRLPQFRLQDPWLSSQVTLADLLSHRSGLPAFAGDMLEDLGLDQATILQRMGHLPTAYPYRAGYAYTNFGYTAAGLAAAQAAQTDYASLLERQVFGPLGMKSSSARFSDYSQASNRAFSHFLQPGKSIVTQRQPDAQAPAGGVSSTARDMAQWMRLHLNHGRWQGQTLISERALGETYQVHAVTSNNPANFSARGFYGLGWGISYDDRGRLRLSHSGAFFLGVRSAVTLLPDENLGVVVLSNGFPAALPEAVSAMLLRMYDTGRVDLEYARSVEKQVLQGLLSMVVQPASEQPTPSARPPAPLSNYLGRYRNNYHGEAEIRQDGKGLVLHLGSRNFPLVHLEGDAFVARVPAQQFENLTSFEILFCGNSRGQMTGFAQKSLGEPGWFERHQP